MSTAVGSVQNLPKEIPIGAPPRLPSTPEPIAIDLSKFQSLSLSSGFSEFVGFKFNVTAKVPTPNPEKMPPIFRGRDGIEIKILGVGEEVSRIGNLLGWQTSYREQNALLQSLSAAVETSPKHLYSYGLSQQTRLSEIRIVDFVGEIITPAGERVPMRALPYQLPTENDQEKYGMLVTRQVANDPKQLHALIRDFHLRKYQCDASNDVQENRTVAAQSNWRELLDEVRDDGVVGRSIRGIPIINSQEPFNWGIDISGAQNAREKLAVLALHPYNPNPKYSLPHSCDNGIQRYYLGFWQEKLIPFLNRHGHAVDPAMSGPKIIAYCIDQSARNLCHESAGKILELVHQYVFERLPFSTDADNRIKQTGDGIGTIQLGELTATTLSKYSAVNGMTCREAALFCCSVVSMLKDDQLLPLETLIYRLRNASVYSGAHAFARAELPTGVKYFMDAAKGYFGPVVDLALITKGLLPENLYQDNSSNIHLDDRENREPRWSYYRTGELANLIWMGL